MMVSALPGKVREPDSENGGGGWPVSWHIHTQGAVHFSLHSEHTSCIMARIVLLTVPVSTVNS
jgi:hypothetical protein